MAMRHSNEMEKAKTYMEKENSKMKETYNRMSTELDRLKKKEMEFNQVISKRLE